MLQPNQPARFAVVDSGFRLIIISVVKNCFGMMRKFSTSQLLEYVKKKKLGFLF
jgi:hypothetical protein